MNDRYGIRETTITSNYESCCYKVVDNILQIRMFKNDVDRLNFMKRNEGYAIIDSVLINYET